MLEKMAGFAVIVVTITLLCLISLLNPSPFLQLIIGLVGSGCCLIGIVFLFAEGRLVTKDQWLKSGWLRFGPVRRRFARRRP